MRSFANAHFDQASKKRFHRSVINSIWGIYPNAKGQYAYILGIAKEMPGLFYPFVLDLGCDIEKVLCSKI